MDLEELTYIIRGAVFEVNRAFKATGHKIGLLVNLTHPKAEVKRFAL